MHKHNLDHELVYTDGKSTVGVRVAAMYTCLYSFAMKPKLLSSHFIIISWIFHLITS